MNRIAARIDIAGTVDTTTRFTTAHNANNIRSAVTNDGNQFWVAGAGGSAAGGVWYNTLGTTGAEIRISSTPNNVRWLQIVGGQLHGSSNTGVFTNVFTIGTGLPTTLVASTKLPGLPDSTGSPFGYVLLDVTPTVVGVDTLYIADDGTTAGIQKYTFNGTTWSSAGTLNTSTPTGFKGLAGYVVSGTVTLVASTIASTQNELVVFVDTGSSVTATPLTLTPPAATNTVYRGVALSPHFQP